MWYSLRGVNRHFGGLVLRFLDSDAKPLWTATNTLLLHIQIKDAMGNDHGRPKDVVGEMRQLFTAPADTAFDVCFENQLTGHSKSRCPQTNAGIHLAENGKYYATL